MTDKKSRIPHFKNLQEEAEFWDTHDTTDYEDEFKPVKVRFAKHLSGVMTIRLSIDDTQTLHHIAEQKGIGTSTLARMWIKQALQEEKHHL